MFRRGPLVPFTRRSSGQRAPASHDEGVRDLLRRLQEAEDEVARTIQSLDGIAALLRGGSPEPPRPAPVHVPETPGLRRSVRPR